MLRIKYELDKRGISQKQLAERVGITPQAISRIVNGTEPAYTKRGQRIADALNWPTDRANELFETIKEVS